MLSSEAATASSGCWLHSLEPDNWRVSCTGASADPHAVLLAGAEQFAAAVGPIPVPEAGRELLYKLQVRSHQLVLLAAGV
jgi:hypothetical protein